MGDAVPGLVVNMSFQLPSIKLELVCIQTVNAKRATFVSPMYSRKFTLVNYMHGNGGIHYLYIV